MRYKNYKTIWLPLYAFACFVFIFEWLFYLLIRYLFLYFTPIGFMWLGYGGYHVYLTKNSMQYSVNKTTVCYECVLSCIIIIRFCYLYWIWYWFSTCHIIFDNNILLIFWFFIIPNFHSFSSDIVVAVVTKR